MATWSKDPDDNIPVARGRLRRLLPSGVWHFYFKDLSGKWMSRLTGHRDKRGATRWAEAHSLNLTDQQFRPDAPPDDESTLVPAPSVGRIVVLWLRYHREQSSEETVRTYRSIGRKFLGFLGERGIRDIAAVTRPLLMEYRTFCPRRGNGRPTVDNNLIALRAPLNWVVSRKWIAKNPASQSRVGERLFFDAESVRKPTYTRMECDRIMEKAEGDAWAAFVLLASWGLRISELAMLEWSDLDYHDRWVNIQRKVTHAGVEYSPKDKEDRRLPLEGKRVLAALEHFAERTGRSGYVVPLNTRGRRQSYAERTFIKILKDVGARAEIGPIKLCLHNFRHYFFAECADRGVPMATVMDWVGHADMKMVMYYYRLRDTTAREAMRRFVGEVDGSSPSAAPADDGRSNRGHRPTSRARHARRRKSASAGHPSRGPRNRTAR